MKRKLSRPAIFLLAALLVLPAALLIGPLLRRKNRTS